MESSNRRLMWHGMCLFLVGLLTGFGEQHFANMRMGLAAPLEGVANGTFLIALGAIWNDVRLSGSANNHRILDRALRHLCSPKPVSSPTKNRHMPCHIRLR